MQNFYEIEYGGSPWNGHYLIGQLRRWAPRWDASNWLNERGGLSMDDFFFLRGKGERGSMDGSSVALVLYD